MNSENTPNIPKSQLVGVFKEAFGDVQSMIETSRESAIESQNNQFGNSGAVPIQTGVQNILITLLLEIARKLGLKEDELEKVFEEVLKLLSTYKNKKGET